MINYEKQYKDLHGAEVETIMYIADKYASVLNENNAGICSDLKTRQAAFDNELKKIADKDFMIVYGMRNNNKRLIRKYRSSQFMRTKSTESFAESITFKFPENIFFMTMDKKNYDKFMLDEDMRCLPGVPSTILELDAMNNGRGDDPHITYILGPDAVKLAKLLGVEDPKISSYESYKNVKVAKNDESAPHQSAINLPLFTVNNDGNKTYQECVDAGMVMCITKGNENYTRTLDKSTSIWRKESIGEKFRDMASWTNADVFKKKIAYIKMGDYKRIQKYIKDTTELPNWDEYLTSVFTKDKSLVEKMFSLGTKRSVKDATSIFSSYTEAYYNQAKHCIETYFNNTPSEKQKTFIEDLKTCADIRNSSCNYKAGDTANAINNWLKLGVADPRGSATNYIDLNLKTKYPWVEILNTYYCDEESAMKEILKIVDRY